jgi:CubicO group peptidase (beta-lactamase class C family)
MITSMAGFGAASGTAGGLRVTVMRAVSAMFATLLFITPWTTTTAQSAHTIPASRIDSVFGHYTSKTPGCALLIRKDGTTVYAHSYGLASLEFSVPITQSTVFNIGSASKEFTAASVLLLAQDHKLSLDDDIRQYVPELPDLGAVVTIRQLLTHTSGWRDYVQLLSWQGHYVRDYVTPSDALNVLEHQRELSFQPGTDFRYSNTGFFLMSLVVQRVSGESLAEFAQKRIFEPLGMRNTRYVTDARDVIPNAATAYEPAPHVGWREAMSDWNLVGAGGVYTTTEDLARWDDNFTSARVGGLALIDSLTTPEHLSNGVAIPYGLGLFVDEYDGQHRIWHNGIWAGYRSIFMRFPDARLSIIALCNAADAQSELLADGVAGILLPPQPTPRQPALASLRVGNASQIAGLYYSAASDQRLSIVVDSGAVAIDGLPARPLIPEGARRFHLPAGTTVLEFQPAVGQAHSLLANNDGRITTYSRVAPPLSPTEFGQYAGRYRSDELGTEWTILADSGKVSLRDARGEDTPLRPTFGDAFDGVGTVHFERSSTGAVIALTVTTYGVNQLRFVRV